jgi:uncharacterized protein with von Willebrand factor type A (vWA) domain
MKKTTVIAITGAMVLGAGLLFPTLVSADENGDTFIQRFAERFNVSEDEVEGVVQEMREEHRTERYENREGVVSQALEDGDLTERQGEILNAMHQIQEEIGIPKFKTQKQGDNHVIFTLSPLPADTM